MLLFVIKLLAFTILVWKTSNLFCGNQQSTNIYLTYYHAFLLKSTSVLKSYALIMIAHSMDLHAYPIK